MSRVIDYGRAARGWDLHAALRLCAYVCVPIVLVLLSLLALRWGAQLRRDVYESNMDVHFYADAMNGWGWGQHAWACNIVGLYEVVEHNPGVRSHYLLDYTPLRVVAVASWYAWTQAEFPDETAWRRGFDFTAPMFWGNTIAAAVSAVIAFLIIRMWTIRADDQLRPEPVPPRMFRGVAAGMFGAMFLWLNPAALWDGFGWCQWEIWPVPFYLGAVYLACRNWWFCAGAALAVGSMLKPQMLVAAPVLFLWPLFQLRFDALLRLVAGLALVGMMIVFPFMLPTATARLWYLLALAALGLTAPFVLRWGSKWLWMACLLAAVLLAWPWASQASLLPRLGAVAIVVVVTLSRFLPFRIVPHVYALAVALVILMIIPLFDGKTGWYDYGFVHGPKSRQHTYQPPMYNIPAMGTRYLQWGYDNDYLVDAPLLGPTSIWKLGIILQGICLLLCGVGAALQERLRDPRFLIAMMLPWLTMYMTLTQQQSRYLMWAAVMSAMLAAVGVGNMLLGIIITALGWLSIDQNIHNSSGNPPRLPSLEGLDPHLGWMLLLVVGIFMYQVLTIRKRDRSAVPECYKAQMAERR